MTPEVTTLMEELLGHVRDASGPDRGRILRTRALVAELVRAAPRSGGMAAIGREFNSTFLMLQFAALSEDAADARGYRAKCLGLAQALGAEG